MQIENAQKITDLDWRDQKEFIFLLNTAMRANPEYFREVRDALLKQNVQVDTSSYLKIVKNGS